jgi:hypothetical protein
MKKFLVSLLSFAIIVPFFSAGCSLTEPINDFQQGPVGMIEETSPDTASWTADAPTQLYDIEGLAGGVFEGVLSRNWNLASTNLSQLITAWTEAKSFLQDPQNNLRQKTSSIILLQQYSHTMPMYRNKILITSCTKYPILAKTISSLRSLIL